VSTFSDKVTESMQTLMDTAWNETAGTTVPKTTDVALKNGAVRLEAAYLYADLGSRQCCRNTSRIGSRPRSSACISTGRARSFATTEGRSRVSTATV